MGRAPCCDKANVKKGPWSPEEDEKLKHYIQTHGTGGNWIALPQKAGLRRCGKSCRLRWLNYLRPNIKHGEFSDDEDRVICALFASIGSRWSIMAAQLPGRTDNDIKNYWNTKLKKKMMNTLISMPHHEIRNKPLAQSPFTFSTNYSYPSPSSTFHHDHTNNINIKSPLSSSPPSSYMYNSHTTTTSNTNYHHDHHQTLSIPSSPVHLQSQDQGYLGSYQGVKDSSTLVMLGGHDQAAAATSSTSNSDGSGCQYDQYGGGISMYDHKDQFGVNFDGKEKGYYGDYSSLDSSLEEIKQLISTNFCSSKINNDNSSLNFFADETKEVKKAMYYY